MNPDSHLRDYMLDLIARPGAIEILVALREHPTTVAEIQSSARNDATPILRALTVAGLARRHPPNGTWDTELPPADTLSLTPQGCELMATLNKINDWGLRRAQPTIDGSR
jgi:DNA-binding HxlR family transcriptional regulator